MRKPNLFIIGAAKSGTTSLYKYLSRHPQVFVSLVKEPKFFSLTANVFPHTGPGDDIVDKTIVRTMEEYLALFENCKDEKYLCEASADYLYFHKTVAPRLKDFNPDAKIIILLRNPVDRAFSAYKHMVRDGREALTFENAIKNENMRRALNYEFIWYYIDVGFYYAQVKTYISYFEENVKIILYDDLSTHPIRVLNDIAFFLNIKKDVWPSLIDIYNASQVPRFKMVDFFLNDNSKPLKKILRPLVLKILGKESTERMVNYLKNKNTLNMKRRTRAYLIDIYKEDILKLQTLIDKDLSAWL